MYLRELTTEAAKQVIKGHCIHERNTYVSIMLPRTLLVPTIVTQPTKGGGSASMTPKV